MNTKIYALHGFLGLPADWSELARDIPTPCEAVELLSFSSPIQGLQKWGHAFNHWVAKQPAQRRILMGYSQGGRLAMHALIDAPELWEGAIIISAHPGLKSLAERDSRLAVDIQWANRFLHDPWEVLLRDWNDQAVFQRQSLSFHRKEENFCRLDLAHAIEGWSVGKQSDLQEPLSKLPLPILWCSGEKDLKYVGLAKEMAVIHPDSSCWIAPEAGHRVPWECSPLFLEAINGWLQRFK